jgi:hypothetical protein
MLKTKQRFARELTSPTDIITNDEVFIGYNSRRQKFVVIENFLDNRIHVITRHMLQDLDDPKKACGFAVEINRFQEGMTIVDILKIEMNERKNHIWAFESADLAMSWLGMTVDEQTGKA